MSLSIINFTHGKNPFLFGILSIITPINLIILGYWAFSGTKEQKK